MSRDTIYQVVAIVTALLSALDTHFYYTRDTWQKHVIHVKISQLQEKHSSVDGNMLVFNVDLKILTPKGIDFARGCTDIIFIALCYSSL